MKKDILSSILEDYLRQGCLKECYSGSDCSVFCFLDCVYVGFVHTDSEETEPAGALLTAAEAKVIACTGDTALICSRLKEKNSHIVFSGNTPSLCQSAIGRWRLRRRIKSRFCHSAKDIEFAVPLPDHIPPAVGKNILQEVSATRTKHVRKYRRNAAITRVLAIIPVLTLIAAPIFVICRKNLVQTRPSVAFDKMSESNNYAYVEADVLVPFAELLDPAQSNYLYGTYYLYGNTQTGSYGLMKFKDIIQEDALFPEASDPVRFAEPIRLYGTPTPVPYQLILLPRSTSSFFPNQIIILPDGTSVTVPGTTPTITIPDLNDFSKDAVAQLAAWGITIDSFEHGETCLFATTEPETIDTPTGALLSDVILCGIFVSGALLLPCLFFATKSLSKRPLIQSINRGELTSLAFNRILPVRIQGQSIQINSAAYFDYIQSAKQPFELRHSILLTKQTPVITLLEDGCVTRTYTLETEGDENFCGKYFLTSVRLYVQGKPAAPVLQIDGFISDTPEDRAITYSDIGYRMEGHFLACGGAVSERRAQMNRGQDLMAKGLRYPGYTTPSNIRLVGICPDCGKSFTFHGYAYYMTQNDVAYSDDGLDCCVIGEYSIDKDTWSYTEDSKTFRYYNSFCCPHCGAAYIDYKSFPENKIFGVSGCVHLGRKDYHSK